MDCRVDDVRPEAPIHVCIISPLGADLYASAGACSGGAEFQLFLLAKGLAAEVEYTVSVLVTACSSGENRTVDGLTVVTRRAGGRLIRKARYAALSAWIGYLSAFIDMLFLLRSIGADVYIHAGAGVEVGAYAAICRLLRKRFIFIVASTADVREVSGRIQSPLKRLYAWGVRGADVVVCRSKEQQALLKANFGKESVLIRTAYPDDMSEGRPSETVEKDGLLWVGRVVPLKRPKLFLDVVRRFPHVPCTMVIMKDEGHADLWTDIRNEAAAIPNLSVREHIPWTQMKRYYERAGILLSTSDYEGFPNTFVQAAMAHTPILSLAVDPDGILERQRLGACAGGSFQKLLTLSQQFLASESVRAESGSRAYRYAMEHHRLSEAVARFKRLIYDMVGRKPASRVCS